MRELLCTFVLVLYLPGLAARADQVTLANGDRLTGTILELNAENLRLKSDLFGEVTIPRQAVAALSADERLAVTLPDGRVTTATLRPAAEQVEIRAETETLTVPLQDIQSLRTPENQAKYERRLHPRWFENWQLGLNTAFSARGGGGTTRISYGMDVKRITRNDEFRFYLQSLLETEKKGSVVNDDKTLALALYAHDIKQNLYYFGTVEIDRDALQHLNLRLPVGGGLGWRVKETNRVHFDVVGGAAIDFEFFQDETNRRSGEGLLGQELNWQIASRMYLQERWILYPNFSRGGEFRTRISTTLETKINNWLGWQLSFSNHYLSDPPPQTDKNDMLLTSGIRLTLGQKEEGRISLRPK